MKNKLYTLGVTGFAAAVTFGLSACGDDVTKYYDSEGEEVSITDTLLVSEVIKDYDTVKVTEVVTDYDTVKVTDVVTKYDTVSATEIVKSIDTVKTTVLVKDTIRDTINVEVIPQVPEAELVYGTVDLSWAQFFYGEINNVAGELNAEEGVYDAASASVENYDAFTSATTSKYANYAQLDGVVDGTTTKFNGLKAVNVAISKALYEDVKKNGSADDKSDLYSLVSNMTVLDEAPVEYKVINSDGSLSKTYGSVINRNASSYDLQTNATWGNYMVTLNGVDIPEANTGNIQAVILETEDGSKYGLIQGANIWLEVNEFAFDVKPTTDVHGADLPYAANVDLPGKRISNVHFLMKDQADVNLSTSIYVPVQLAVTAAVAEDNSTISFTISDDINSYRAAELALTSYTQGSGRTAVTTAVSGGTFSSRSKTIKFSTAGLKAGTYTFNFTDAAGIASSQKVAVTLESDGAAVEDLSGVVYGTVDLSYAQFFYGEFNDLEGDLSATAGDYASASVVSMDDYDAYTSATTGKYGQFAQAATTVSEDNSSVSFDGVKAVNVVISKALLREAQAKIAAGATAVDGNDLMALVAAATWDETASEPAEYKVINANGSVSKTYGKTVARTPSSVEVTTGSHWGDYEFAFDAVSISDLTGANVQAVTLETEDGAKYGLVPLINVWMNVNNLGFFVGANSDNEPYAQFTDIPGKRMVKATYFTKDGNDVELNFNVYMPQFATIQMGTATYDATAKTYTDFTEATEFKAGDVITFYSVPVNRYSTMKLAQYGVGSDNGRALSYTYTDIANGGSISTRSNYVTYTIPSDWAAGSYSLKFVDNNGIAADVVLTFTVTAAE